MRRRDFLKIVIDLDGTILEEKTARERPEATPLPGAVEAVNRLYEMGHIIIIHTARTDKDLELTLKQLNEYGIKYHRLVLGKPVGDIFIDDRAFAFRGWDTGLSGLLELIEERMSQPFEEKND